MFQNLFRNMPDVVKNLLILNVLMFVAKLLMESKGVSLDHLLGMHYVESKAFEPYQIVTYMFMHGSPMHLFFNMFALVIFGSALERVWGPKRFFTFYLVTGVGALIVHVLVAYFRMQDILVAYSPEEQAKLLEIIKGEGLEYLKTGQNYIEEPLSTLNEIFNIPMVGASGAIFGLLLAFALYFPNTQLMLLFPPIPIKAKYFVGIYVVLELYLGYSQNGGDNVAHFAHLGGALFGFILVMIWKKNRSNFY